MHFPKKRRSPKSQEEANTQQAELDAAVQAFEDGGYKHKAQETYHSLVDTLRHRINTTPAYQWGICCFSCFMLIWTACATGLLLDFSTSYIFGMVDKDREWYVMNAAVSLAQARAAHALMAALRARDALCMAVHSGLVTGSNAYAAIERVLVPALLAGHFVSHVEMAFPNSDDVLVVGKRSVHSGQYVLTMQSTSSECYLLGVEGCLETTGESGPPEWPSDYADLPMDAIKGYGSGAGSPPAMARLSVASGWEAPMLVPTKYAIDGTASAWSPSYRLGFSCGGSLRVAGRVTLELGTLSGGGDDGWFHDPRLGGGGLVYLVDRAGQVLASRSPADLLVVRSGRLRFARAWELRGQSWAPELRSAFRADGGAIAETRLLHEGVQVAVQQLPAPLDHFGILVVAPAREPFVNHPLLRTSFVALVVALVPWASGLLAGIVIFIRQWRRNDELRAMDPARQLREGAGRY